MNQITEYYLVEVNKQGEESPLTQNYSNSFMRGATPNTAFKFNEEEKVKQAYKVQSRRHSVRRNSRGAVNERRDRIDL
ncbi:hypothetical protein O0594_000784 [Staphylococcus pseudintermedius]|nr:hypothetical protein [Staphylococcus pseudintermedius]